MPTNVYVFPLVGFVHKLPLIHVKRQKIVLLQILRTPNVPMMRSAKRNVRNVCFGVIVVVQSRVCTTGVVSTTPRPCVTQMTIVKKPIGVEKVS